MKIKSFICDLGTLSYQEAHQLQKDCVSWRSAEKSRPDLFLVVEHAPVFTLGRRGLRNSLLVDEKYLSRKGIALIGTERGGDITYHGPGQLVLYPIFSLRRDNLNLQNYINALEELMIFIAAEAGVDAVRDKRNRGVWVGNNKIGSIGISVRRGIAFHGMALNVTPDLEPFRWINPCGLAGVGVTSIEQETENNIDFTWIKACLIKKIADIFDRQTEMLCQSDLMEKIYG